MIFSSRRASGQSALVPELFNSWTTFLDRHSLSTLLPFIMLGHSHTLSVVLVVALQSLGASAQACDTYVVPSISGGFTQRTFIDFSTVSPSSNSAASLLL